MGYARFSREKFSRALSAPGGVAEGGRERRRKGENGHLGTLA